MFTFYFEKENPGIRQNERVRIEIFIPLHSKNARMAQPLILVTGSTDGIGRATAAGLASGGAELILHGKNEKRGKAVQRELGRIPGVVSPDLVIADFSRLDQVRQMAADIATRWSRLDVLINNAGTYQTTRQVTGDGIEMSFAVNYLGPFLLTHLLLPLLRKSPGARIVTVASSAHEDVDRIDWENLPQEPRYDPWAAYSLSKFADVTFTYSLARHLEGTGITANCLHPGVVDTKLSHAAAPGYPAITPEEGAQTSIFLARSEMVAGVSGRYFERQHTVRSSALSHNRGVQDRLWTMAEELTGITGEIGYER
jgi:NAD(P)-dependent dehydrogenase (short-subunit alcohol dehydrogenase family)